MNTKIFKVICVICAICGFVSCSSDEDPFFTAAEDDMPRFLNTDIPEGSKGEPGVIATIDRATTTNFTFEVMVTPVHYTTVTWFVDDLQVAEGLTIDVPVMAGQHTVKIVATTTKGKSTSRTCRLVVLPSPSEPYPNGKDIHETLVKPGTVATLHGDNMSMVAKVIIGGKSADATYHADGDYVEYTVPQLPDGTYPLQLADAQGTIYGAGTIEVNENPEYPVTGEKTIWEGSFNVTWGTPFNALQTELATIAHAGDILRVYVTGNGQGTAATAWWRNLLTGISDDDEPGGRGDVKIEGDMVLEYTLNELSMRLLAEQDGFFMVGDGYTVLKVTIEEPTETTLWEGSFNVTWGTPFDGLKTELINHVKAGTMLRAYVTGEGQGTAATAWWRNIVTGISEDDEPGGRGDVMISGDMVLEYRLTDLSIKLLQEQDGFLMVGDGYTLTKITVE